MDQPDPQHYQDTGAPRVTSAAIATARKRSAMPKFHRLLAAAAVTAIAVIGTVTGITAASASPGTGQAVQGTEYIQVMSASATGGPASAIARGAFTAAGKAYLGQARNGRIVFPDGTITVSHRPGRGTSQIDPRTCLNLISQAGTYQITGGTGRYAGIRGHGTYELSLEFISALSHGRCTSGKPPVAQQQLLRLFGPVQL
jgi:hypothetical protein